MIEAYEGDHPPDVVATLAPVYAELGNRGYISGAALASEVHTRISRDAGSLTPSQILDAQRQVDDAYAKFIDGEYSPALVGARTALALYDGAPGQLAREPALRDLRYKALVVASRSSEVMGNAADAFALMAELVRSFPDRPVTSAQFDPKVSALYHRVTDELARQGTGSLEVKVDDPGVTVFVDERFGGAGNVKLGNLAPGHYRLYSSKGQVAGRVHDVEISPHGSSSFAISWRVDNALQTSNDAVTLDLERDATTDVEVQSATEIARSLGAKTVIVLSVRPINGRRAIAGYSISVESQTRAFAGIQIEPIEPSAEMLKQLAALLAGDKVAAPGLITTEPARVVHKGDEAHDVKLVPARDDEPRWYDDRLGWILASAGAVALGGGTFFEVRASSLDDQASRETSQTERQRQKDNASTSRRTGEVMLVAGGAVLVAGIVKLLLVPSGSHATLTARTPKTSLSVGPSWVGVSVSF